VRRVRGLLVLSAVMPGLDPGIHVFVCVQPGSKAWMAGTSPAMTGK
jgi:hypothetical protein